MLRRVLIAAVGVAFALGWAGLGAGCGADLEGLRRRRARRRAVDGLVRQDADTVALTLVGKAGERCGAIGARL